MKHPRGIAVPKRPGLPQPNDARNWLQEQLMEIQAICMSIQSALNPPKARPA
jgi:hypothetical protein